ncbi:MAG: amidohydrolase [Chloroflexota bacterium]|nr:amidohydrolase [Chloroflexota bacterium]
MKQADTILSGGIVVTMNREFDLIYDGAVAIKDEKIVAVGAKDDILKTYSSDNIIDCAGKYITPGLVNAHTHVPMTLLRGLADDLRLDVWLLGYMMPTERKFVTPEFCRLGTKIACAEMIRSGVTAFADMYYFESEVAAATAEAGMRGVLGESIIKFPTPDAVSYEEGLAYARKFIQDWNGHPLITPAVAPHAPYTNTDETMRLATELAVEYDVPLLIHTSETAQEVQDMIDDTGMRVIEKLDGIKMFRAKTLCAHCVHIKPFEMRIMADRGATAAHCPTSNLKLASGIASVHEMLKQNVTVGIGTDGPASNNDLDMFAEIHLAAILAKTAANDPTALPARTAFLMATRQGADALFIGNKTGSLEVGKLADVIVVDGSPLHNMPQFDRDPNAVYSRLVYATKSTDVRHVICHGKWLMRDRELLTLDEAALLEQAAQYALKIDAFLRGREENVLSKLVAISELEQAESFEVQFKAAISSEAVLDKLLNHPEVQVLRFNHYRQYDSYFLFDDEGVERVRYREDDKLDAEGEVESVRTRLTYSVPTIEREFDSAVLLFRSRFIADATRPLRFYREYFQPKVERQLEKDRRRWHILYQGVLYYVNLDRILKPQVDGLYVELKSRTYSMSDAELKSQRMQEMLDILGIAASDVLRTHYIEMDAAKA